MTEFENPKHDSTILPNYCHLPLPLTQASTPVYVFLLVQPFLLPKLFNYYILSHPDSLDTYKILFKCLVEPFSLRS